MEAWKISQRLANKIFKYIFIVIFVYFNSNAPVIYSIGPIGNKIAFVQKIGSTVNNELINGWICAYASYFASCSIMCFHINQKIETVSAWAIPLLWYVLFCCFWLFYILMPYNIKYFIFVYLIFMSLIVLYFLHNTSVLSFYIDVVLTLSIPSFMPHHGVSLWHPLNVFAKHLLITCGLSFLRLRTTNMYISLSYESR